MTAPAGGERMPSRPPSPGRPPSLGGGAEAGGAGPVSYTHLTLPTS
ncbi:hypothetical protein [Streptomyces rochei]